MSSSDNASDSNLVLARNQIAPRCGVALMPFGCGAINRQFPITGHSLAIGHGQVQCPWFTYGWTRFGRVVDLPQCALEFANPGRRLLADDGVDLSYKDLAT